MYRLSAAFGGRTGFRRWRGSKRTKVLHRTETRCQTFWEESRKFSCMSHQQKQKLF